MLPPNVAYGKRYALDSEVDVQAECRIALYEADYCERGAIGPPTAIATTPPDSRARRTYSPGHAAVAVSATAANPEAHEYRRRSR
jgi:hypothetical protein